MNTAVLVKQDIHPEQIYSDYTLIILYNSVTLDWYICW